MHLLMTARYIPPFYSGAGKRAMYFARLLVSRGHAVNLVGISPDRSYRRSVEGRLVIERIGNPAGLMAGRSGIMGLIGEYLLSARFAASVKPRVSSCDMLYCMDISHISVAAANAARLMDKSYVMRSTLMGSDDPLYLKINGGYVRRGAFSAIQHAGGFRAISPAIMQSYLEAGLPRERAMLLPSAIDENTYAPVSAGEKQSLRRQLGIPLDKIIVVYTGLIDYRKGVDRLIEAWRSVSSRPEGSRMHLLLVGPTSRRRGGMAFYKRLLEIVHDFGLQNAISFVGEVDSVVSYLQASDVFAFLSRREGLVASVAEATMCGLPAVMADLPGISDYLIEHNRSGFIVDGDDYEGVAERILALARDESLRHEFGVAARESAVRRFSNDVVYQGHLRLFDIAMRRA